ncbi:MAG: hypothetical protein GX951_03490 [Mollicutes bacterium]|nr:hypothetical protein [Mollicutes bacterium]
MVDKSISKREYQKKINSLRKSYSKKFNSLYEEYLHVLNDYSKEKMRYIMSKHKKIIIKTIQKIISFFPQEKIKDWRIFLTGSLARNTNLIFSDVDISFIYGDSDIAKKLNLENKISYMISYVLGYKGRDRVHGITNYLPIISNNYLDNIKNNKYSLHF